jgi:hypothetical protein
MEEPNGTHITVDTKMILPVSVTWKPQPDITVYELAQLIPLFVYGHIMSYDLPKDERLLRHLDIHDPNK